MKKKHLEGARKIICRVAVDRQQMGGTHEACSAAGQNLRPSGRAPARPLLPAAASAEPGGGAGGRRRRLCGRGRGKRRRRLRRPRLRRPRPPAPSAVTSRRPWAEVSRRAGRLPWFRGRRPAAAAVGSGAPAMSAPPAGAAGPRPWAAAWPRRRWSCWRCRVPGGAGARAPVRGGGGFGVSPGSCGYSGVLPRARHGPSAAPTRSQVTAAVFTGLVFTVLWTVTQDTA